MGEDWVVRERGKVQLWRACNLTSFSPCLTGPVDYLFASLHKGPRFKSKGGYSCETGILLLAMSRYTVDIGKDKCNLKIMCMYVHNTAH